MPRELKQIIAGLPEEDLKKLAAAYKIKTNPSHAMIKSASMSALRSRTMGAVNQNPGPAREFLRPILEHDLKQEQAIAKAKEKEKESDDRGNETPV